VMEIASAGQTTERTTVGIVLECSRSGHPWQDHCWHAQALIPEGGPAGDWRLLTQGPGWRRFYAGTLPLELHRGETEGYRENLLSSRPAIYIVLRKGVGGHELAPLLITACPHEAQSYGGDGDDVVEAVPMPALLEAWIRRFVERHHIEKAFVKRKQKPKSGDSGTGPAQLRARTNQVR
jgi:hypothetical protein